MTNPIKALLLTSALALVSGPALAQSQGDLTFGIGIGNVDPKSDNGSLADGALSVDVDDNTRPIFTVEYFIRDNLGIELLVAAPFDHDISLNGDQVASTKHLPPTLSLNYHFPTNSAWKPYIGAGINYTTFFEEEIDGARLDLDDSIGFSVQAGLDYQLTDKSALRFNVRYFDIDTDASVNGDDVGTVEIDPVLIGVAYVFSF